MVIVNTFIFLSFTIFSWDGNNAQAGIDYRMLFSF